MINLINTTIEELAERFEDESITEQLKEATIYVSLIDDSYAYESSAMILYEIGSKLFIVEAGHCSCYGYEDQWKPGEINWKSLDMRNYFTALSSDSTEVLKKLIASKLNG